MIFQHNSLWFGAGLVILWHVVAQLIGRVDTHGKSQRCTGTEDDGGGYSTFAAFD